MKKITFTFVLITLASLAVFAAGSAEDTSTMPWAQGRGQYQSDAVISEETTTITGTVNLIENGHVELIVGDETYELVYPYRLSYAADLQNGMEITVEGFMAENMRFDNDESTKNLMVQSATIGGQTYDISESMTNDYGAYGRMAMNNQRGGYMGNNSQLQGSMGGYDTKGNFYSNTGGNSYNNMPMGRGGRSGQMSSAGRMSGHMGGSFAPRGGYSQNNFFGWNRR